MPLVLGLASSHAPSMFAPAEKWPALHQVLTRGLPQPPQLAEETLEVRDSYVQRIQNGFRILKEQLDSCQPEALIIVGDDQGEVFSKAFIPQMAIYLGERISGTTSIALLGERYDENHLTLSCQAELARALLMELMDRGFDVSYIEELLPLGRPEAGLGHAFMRPANALRVAETGLPVVIFFLNAYHPPLPSAKRCYQLGQAIAESLASRPERIAILASGGLSHDPGGPRAGWVDEPLDHWVLDHIARGEGYKLQNLFTFDSDTMRSGTGEIRSWITVAGAFHGRRATVVDYLPARHAVTGLGFAYWNGE